MRLNRTTGLAASELGLFLSTKGIHPQRCGSDPSPDAGALLWRGTRGGLLSASAGPELSPEQRPEGGEAQRHRCIFRTRQLQHCPRDLGRPRAPLSQSILLWAIEATVAPTSPDGMRNKWDLKTASGSHRNLCVGVHSSSVCRSLKPGRSQTPFNK